MRILGAQACIEFCIAGRGVLPALLEGTVEKQNPIARQNPRRTAHKRCCRFPRRDMDHVDAKYRIGLLHRPGVSHHVKHQGQQKIGKLRFSLPCRDAGNGSRVWIGRLEAKRREMCREMQRVFARTTRDFQHQTCSRQMARQDFRDGGLVARNGRREAARIF